MLNEKIIIEYDTREKTPYIFPKKQYKMVLKSLKTADYRICVDNRTIYVERKTLDDFVNTVIHNWDRFDRELQRLCKLDIPMIVVEGSIQDIADKTYTSNATPKSILGRANQIFMRYPKIVLYFAGDRQKSIQWIIKNIENVKQKGVI